MVVHIKDLVTRLTNTISTKPNKKNAGMITCWKFKGKLFTDIAKLDVKYLEWISKNRKYISKENQDILDQVISKLTV